MLITAAPAVGAQSAADRAALDALRDSLDARTTAAAVAEVPSDWAAKRASAMRYLRRGLIALRVGEIGARRQPLDEALTAFGEAAIRERDWAYPRYGLARTKLALNDGEWPPKPQLFHSAGESWYEGFTDAVTRALELDPSFGAAESLAVSVLVEQEQRSQPEPLVRALEQAAASGSADPRIHLVLGRDQRARGDDAGALAAFEAYRSRGGDPGIAQLEIARALSALGRGDEAAEAYWAGLARPSPDARAAYRRDLTWIADSSEIRAFDALSSDEFGPWLRDYWGDRDAIELRTPGERLREHLRRWNYVHARFRIPDPGRRTQFRRRLDMRINPIKPCIDGRAAGINDLAFDDHTWHDDARRRERVLDDRAIIYMRHGAPVRRTSAAGLVDVTDELTTPGTIPSELRLMQEAIETEEDLAEQIPEIGEVSSEGELDLASRNESWLYWFEGKPRLFHFKDSEAAGRHAATTLTINPVESEAYLLAVGMIDPRYRKLAFIAQRQASGQSLARPLTCYDDYQDIRRERRDDMLVAVNTDSYTRMFPVDLTPLVHGFAVGEAAAGSGRVLVVFAVPAARLTPETRRDGREGVVYPLTISAVAYDSTRETVRRLDTVRVFTAPDTLRADEFLTGYVELPIPAGRYEVRAAFVQDSLTGGAGYVNEVELVRPARGLALSDIVLGRAGSGLSWPRGGESVPLNPLGAFTKGGVAELYYEVTGAEPGRTYSTTIEVHRGASGDRRTGTALRFTETAREPVLRVSRSLGLRGLDDGTHRLRVTIEEEGTGRRVVREQTIRIADD